MRLSNLPLYPLLFCLLSTNCAEPSVVWDGSLPGGGGLQPPVQPIRLDLHQGQWSHQDCHGNLQDRTYMIIYNIIYATYRVSCPNFYCRQILTNAVHSGQTLDRVQVSMSAWTENDGNHFITVHCCTFHCSDVLMKQIKESKLFEFQSLKSAHWW